MDAKAFLETYPTSAETKSELLDDPAFRDSVYVLMHPTPPLQLRPLVRDMFQREISYRADESHDGEHSDNIYWTALFLYQIGNFDDVIPMWQAKHISMDTGGGFDIQFLVGCGVEETIEYLHNSDDHSSDEIAAYIVSCQETGDLANLDDWLSDRIKYFD